MYVELVKWELWEKKSVLNSRYYIKFVNVRGQTVLTIRRLSQAYGEGIGNAHTEKNTFYKNWIWTFASGIILWIQFS